MENRAARETEDRKALEAICWTICALARRYVAAVASPPSPYGPYVDAVAWQGFCLAVLAEVDRLQAKLAALKKRAARP
jgi:hypothetical protein